LSHALRTVRSPIGRLTLVASERGLAAVLWPREDPLRVRLGALHEDRAHALLRQVERQLKEYFAGRRARFTVKLDLAGTAFQRKVWRAVLAIPFGETRSYAQLAHRIGHPTASRAVGAANGRNPLSIIVPCHRVLGADGALRGYAGGLDAKRFLLDHEARQPDQPLSATARNGLARRRRGVASSRGTGTRARS
jgi:methylated-DNA-[protein]-cysteine S-methyltransferase